MKTKEEVLSILKTHPNCNIEEPQFKKKFLEHYQILSTWNFPSDFKFTQKLFHYFNDDPELKFGLCPVCGKRCRFASFGGGYLLHCSKDCATKDKNTLIKRKETCINRYGVENASQLNEKKQKIKETLKERYGVEYYSQTQECLNKMQATCKKKYGVINYSQTKEWSHKKQKRYKYNNIYFDSLWEVEVFKYCEKNNIPCEYQPNITFEYSYKNTIHKYHPDFLINGKLYEVKGDHFFEGDKMICPYDRDEYKDGLAEAKHQCMIKNNVIILKRDDIIRLREML